LLKESEAICSAFRDLHEFVDRNDLERRVFHGAPRVVHAPPGFEAAWKDFVENWYFGPLWALEILEPDPLPEAPIAPIPATDAWRPRVQVKAPGELAIPDPEEEEDFDPLRHDGGAAIGLGLVGWEMGIGGALDQPWANSCSLALGAYDYLVGTIGLDIGGVFRRWRRLPVVFMPAHVSNLDGTGKKGSLQHLIDDAMRAYVFGVPCAAIAMCRAALEMVLKRYYGRGQWQDENL
jgi:hypothetical protein